MSSFIKMSGSVLSGSQDGSGYALGVSEFQMLDGLVAGTVQASKLTVVDSNKDITGYRSVTGSGDLFFANGVFSGDIRLDDDLTVGDDAAIGGDLDVTGDMTAATVTMTGFSVDADGDTALKSLAVDNSSTIGCDADADIMTLAAQSLALANDVDFNVAKAGGLQIAGAAVTATAAELNYLDNDDLVAADLQKLADLTATAAEINYLDNDDLVAADIQKLADLTATAAEINLLDDSVAGSVVNSRAVIYGSGGQVNATSLSASAAVSGHSLDIETSANIAGDIDSAGDLTVASITMAEFSVAANGNTDVDGTLNVEGVATFQAAANAASLSASAGVSGHSLDIETTADLGGKLTVVGVSDLDGGIDVNDSKFTVSTAGALSAAALANLDGGIEIDSGGNKFTVSTAGVVVAEGSISGAAGSFDAITGVSLDVQSGGISNAGAIAGATSIDGSGDLTMGTITMSGFSVDGSGNAAAASAKVADISDGGIVFGSGGDGELSVDASLGWNSGASTLAATHVTSSGNHMVGGTLEANSEANFYKAANVHGTFSALGQADLSGDVNIGNATSDTVTVTGRFDSDLLPSTDSARDLGSSALQWAEAHIDAGYIDSLAAAVTASAGLHISAKTGPYSLSIADGAGDAIAQAWVTHSDRNLKTNIQELDSNAALNAVMSLQPSTYEKKATGKSEIGFIAQEVAQVVPEICALDANGEGRGIDYSRMSTLLAGALKAQQEQIAQLKEIVAKLQK